MIEKDCGKREAMSKLRARGIAVLTKKKEENQALPLVIAAEVAKGTTSGSFLFR